MSKIAGPLLDRIDVPAVNYEELRGSDANAQSSAQIRARVIRARQVQLNRFAAAGSASIPMHRWAHARSGPYCDLDADSECLLERAMEQQGLSARGHDRILKVARTITDLEGNPRVESKHLAEAIQYRTLDRTYWT